MSQSTIPLSEYYREHFDPTHHPILYKLINQLTSQALDFQKSVDPVYNCFLLESMCQKSNMNTTTVSSKRKRKVEQRRFAGLSIITCGNSELIGFANIGHVDNDYITMFANAMFLETLNKLEIEYKSDKNSNIGEVLLHLKNKYVHRKRFSTYTTCGYKVFHNGCAKGRRYLRAYFVYNSLSVVVAIPEDSSCYHTFDASYHNHQTSIPFIESETHVSFNDDATFIFAWGNGKSEKKSLDGRAWFSMRRQNDSGPHYRFF